MLNQLPRSQCKPYSLEFLVSLRDTPYCKDKPRDLPEFIDRDKIASESSLSRGPRRNRRQGSMDAESHESSHFKPDNDVNDESRQKTRGNHPGNRRDNMGWQPANHQEHTEQFINRFAHPKSTGPKSADFQGRLIPGKGVPRRIPDQSNEGVANPASKALEHQPALANVVTRQAQGFANFSATAPVQGGLDAFSMGDIRQAEKFLESGRMGLAEYARKVATGEISRDSVGTTQAHAGSFFAEEEAQTSRPWLQQQDISGTRSATLPPQVPPQGRIVPGYASQRSAGGPTPPPPQVAPPRAQPIGKATVPAVAHPGKESNAQGLALLQMLIDKKASSNYPPKSAGQAGPRQLTQQQINELISMSKRAGPKASSLDAGMTNRQAPQARMGGIVQPNIGNTRPVEQQQPNMRAPQTGVHPGMAPAAAQGQTPPHVAALLEQLHRQQLAQQEAERSSSGQTPPPECQQQ